LSLIVGQLVQLIERIVLFLGYPGITLTMALECIFPPLPSELVMPFAGFLVGRGFLEFGAVVVAGTLGSTLGALILYYVGFWVNEPVVRRLLRRWGWLLRVSERDLDRALGSFDRYGDAIVFFGRLVPLVRSLISLPAGMHGMPVGRFLLFTALGSAIWTTALAYAGFFLGDNWKLILHYSHQYEQVAVVAVGLLAATLLMIHLVRRRMDAPVRVV
jgi:membrane protein DedA with SNARE-associated domain